MLSSFFLFSAAGPDILSVPTWEDEAEGVWGTLLLAKTSSLDLLGTLILGRYGGLADA